MFHLISIGNTIPGQLCQDISIDDKSVDESGKSSNQWPTWDSASYVVVTMRPSEFGFQLITTFSRLC